MPRNRGGGSRLTFEGTPWVDQSPNNVQWSDSDNSNSSAESDSESSLSTVSSTPSSARVSVAGSGSRSDPEAHHSDSDRHSINSDRSNHSRHSIASDSSSNRSSVASGSDSHRPFQRANSNSPRYNRGSGSDSNSSSNSSYRGSNASANSSQSTSAINSGNSNSGFPLSGLSNFPLSPSARSYHSDSDRSIPSSERSPNIISVSDIRLHLGELSRFRSTFTPSPSSSSVSDRISETTFSGTPYHPPIPTVRIMAGSSSASSLTFECSVCLESLDAPASIDIGPDQEIIAQVTNSPVSTPGSSRGGYRRRGRGGVASRARAAPPNVTLNDVCSTHCGHIYHHVCLEKWFAEQGKRTCPSCRKSVPPTKLFRLYPSIAAEPVPRNRSATASTDNGDPHQATSNNPSASTDADVVLLQPPAPSVGASSSSTCNRHDCQEFKMIHNTLINDLNELRNRFDALRENDELKEAQIQSLEEDNVRKATEINNLKRELDDSRSGNSSTNSAKRRRH